MYNNNKILVIIPARGASKDIPRKNARLLYNKPIIHYTIDAAKGCEYVDDVIVSSEYDEILRIAEHKGISTIRQTIELVNENSNINHVVYDAMQKKESLTLDEYDIVITVLPSSPLLKSETLSRIIERFDNPDIDTIISVKGDRELYWILDRESKTYYPLYPERENLEFLPKTYKETGNVLATRRRFMTPENRIGKNIDLYEISEEESVHIVSYKDWGIANNYLNKKKMIFIIGLNDNAGIDNIIRCLSLSSKLFFHDITFFLKSNNEKLIEIMSYYNYNHIIYDNTKDLLKKIDEINPQIIFNDFEDTDEKYMATLKEKNYFIINFGDKGSGYPLANLVFDDLNEHKSTHNNVRSGHNYHILKEAFFSLPPITIREEVKHILLFLGVNDENKLTKRFLDLIIQNNFSKYIHVILGSKFKNKDDFMEKYSIYNNIIIYPNADTIDEIMYKSDIAIISAGREMFEICHIGIPSITISKNERELLHDFANEENGFINLGLGKTIQDDVFLEKFNLLINNYNKRLEMHNKMKSIDLEFGNENMWYEVKKEYRKHLKKINYS